MLTDRDCAALTIWGEARGAEVEGRIAVANVLRNRVKDGRWGSTYTLVCRAPYQFSCWNDSNDANHRGLMQLVAEIQVGQQPSDRRLEECFWIVDGLISGKLGERVGFATHYFDDSIAPPRWVQGAHHEATIGRLWFFSSVK